MASTEDLFAAIEAGDVGSVRGIVTADPSLASARDAEGVSAVMRARYRFDRGLVEAVISGEPVLDVFEAAAFGDLDRLVEPVDGDPSIATAFSADGFSVLHLAAFFGQTDAARLLRDRAAEVDAPGHGWMTGTALHSTSSSNHVAIARLLLEGGADPNVRQSPNLSRSSSAYSCGKEYVVERFEIDMRLRELGQLKASPP